jgi:hypothetical protein
MRKFRRGHGLNINRKVDPVEDRTTDPISVILAASGCAAAFASSLP